MSLMKSDYAVGKSVHARGASWMTIGAEKFAITEANALSAEGGTLYVSCDSNACQKCDVAGYDGI